MGDLTCSLLFRDSGHHIGQTLLPISPLHHWQCLLLTELTTSAGTEACAQTQPCLPQPLESDTTVADHVPSLPHEFISSCYTQNTPVLAKDLQVQQLPMESFPLPCRAGRLIWVALCYFETLLSWHRKELRKSSRRKVTETPEKSSLEVYRNFSSTTVQNYKPSDKTRQKQRKPPENG